MLDTSALEERIASHVVGNNVAVRTRSIVATSAQGGDDDNEYAAYEAQIHRNGSPPSWFYADRNIYDEVAAADATAVIAEVECGDLVCRVKIRHESEGAREQFAHAISSRYSDSPAGKLQPSESTVDVPALGARAIDFTGTNSSPSATVVATYRYPGGDRSLTVLYLLKPPSLEEALHKLRATLEM